jgi:hypothetical protein
MMFVRSLIAAVLIGFFVGGMVDAAAQPTPQAQHAERPDARPNERTKRDKITKPSGETLAAILDKTWDDPVALFTFVLAVFTGVLGISSIGLWIVTAKGIRNHARDTQILGRAYLDVEPAGPEPQRLPSFRSSSPRDCSRVCGLCARGLGPTIRVAFGGLANSPSREK